MRLCSLLLLLISGSCAADTFELVPSANTKDCYVEEARIGYPLSGYIYTGNEYNNRYSLLVDDKKIIHFKSGKTYLAFSEQHTPLFTLKGVRTKHTVKATFCRWNPHENN